MSPTKYLTTHSPLPHIYFLYSQELPQPSWEKTMSPTKYLTTHGPLPHIYFTFCTLRNCPSTMLLTKYLTTHGPLPHIYFLYSQELPQPSWEKTMLLTKYLTTHGPLPHIYFLYSPSQAEKKLAPAKLRRNYVTNKISHHAWVNKEHLPHSLVPDPPSQRPQRLTSRHPFYRHAAEHHNCHHDIIEAWNE